MSTNRPPEFELVRLTIAARPEYLAAIAALVRSIGEREGLPARDVDRLESAVDEACTNVVEHAFDPGETGALTLVMRRRPGQLIVMVEDQGLPFDFAEVENGHGGFGTQLIRTFADEVSYLNLGTGGKRVELIKNLPGEGFDQYLRDTDREAQAVQPDISTEPVEIRMMRPDDAVALTRLIYRNYGYTYCNEHLYYPEKVRELLDSGLMQSCVAVTPSGEIAGHLALVKDTIDSMVAESCQAVVDPRFRGRKLFEEIKSYLVAHGTKQGLYGIYSESVTIHPFTQRANIALGATETGFLLGFIPGTLRFKKIHDDVQQIRQTALIYYLRLNPEPPRTVYLPPQHQTMIEEIYAQARLERVVAPAPSTAEPPPKQALLELKFRPEFGYAWIKVAGFGADLVSKIGRTLRQLCLQHVECVYLDLPLARPETAALCAPLEDLGWRYGCIVPEGADGDVLRLQYLNNVVVEPDKIVVVSDFGKKLLNYQLQGFDNLAVACPIS